MTWGKAEEMLRRLAGRFSSAVSAAPAAVLLAFLLLFGSGCAHPMAGAAGIGDPYFESAGNGGYDATHYDISLVVDPVSGRVDGQILVQATAGQDLASFHLDYCGAEIGAVSVDGRQAEFAEKDGELIISCPEQLRTGAVFLTQVTYSGRPQPIEDAESFMVGWSQVGDYIYTLDEPLGAATWFPVNDHPSDKATYTFRITVPADYTATANGALVDTQVKGTDQTFVWEMRQPLASYLASVSVGKYALQEETAPNGVHIRNYFASALAAQAKTAFARTGEILSYFANTFGPYPFDLYGVVVPAVDTGGAMENQTLSLFGRDVLEHRMNDPAVGEFYLSHELAHQWFGDSVTVSRWRDIWLNEGFATYAAWLWLEHDRGPKALAQMVQESLATLAAEDYPPLADPGPEGLFSVNVYRRGALTLHALRITVGDAVFFDILREWAKRYQYANATTADFMALAKEMAPVSQEGELSALFDAWLNGKELPTLPEAAL